MHGRSASEQLRHTEGAPGEPDRSWLQAKEAPLPIPSVWQWLQQRWKRRFLWLAAI
jgi:hypothetical protein